MFKCPCCGSEMKLVTYYVQLSCTLIRIKAYICQKCGTAIVLREEQ